MKFLLLVFIYEAHGFASESSVWVLFSYTVTHTTQQSWNDTTTCRTLTIFIFKNVYFLTRSEVSGVNEATFRDDSLKWITRISSCLGAWDTFLFFSSSLSFFSYSSHTWLVNCMMCDDVCVFAPNSHWPVLSRREGGGGYRHTTRSFPSLMLLCTCKWERVRTSDTKKTFWKLEKMTDDSKISTPWERILSKTGQSKTERINGINRLKLRDLAFLMLDFILW